MNRTVDSKKVKLKKLKPSEDPVEFNKLYIQGLHVAGLDAPQAEVTLNALSGEGLESDKTKDASLHTLHINRLIHR